MSKDLKFSIDIFYEMLQENDFQPVSNDTGIDDYFCVKLFPESRIVSYEHPVIHLPIQLRNSIPFLSKVETIKLFYKVLPFLKYMDSYLSTEKVLIPAAQVANWNLYAKVIDGFYVLKNIAFFIGKERPDGRGSMITNSKDWKFVDSLYIKDTQDIVKKILFFEITRDSNETVIHDLFETEFTNIPMRPIGDFIINNSFVDYFYEQLGNNKDFTWCSRDLQKWEAPILLETIRIINNRLKIKEHEEIKTDILKNNRVMEVLYNDLNTNLSDFLKTTLPKDSFVFKYGLVPIHSNVIIDFVNELPKNKCISTEEVCCQIYNRIFTGFENFD